MKEQKRMLPELPETLKDKADTFLLAMEEAKGAIQTINLELQALKIQSVISKYIETKDEDLKQLAIEQDAKNIECVKRANKIIKSNNSVRLELTRLLNDYKNKIKENVDSLNDPVSILIKELLKNSSDLATEFDRQAKEMERIQLQEKLKKEAIGNYKVDCVTYFSEAVNRLISAYKEKVSQRFYNSSMKELLLIEDKVKDFNPSLNLKSIRNGMFSSCSYDTIIPVRERLGIVLSIILAYKESHIKFYKESIENFNKEIVNKINPRIEELKERERATKEELEKKKQEDLKREKERLELENKKAEIRANELADAQKRKNESKLIADSLRNQALVQQQEVKMKNVTSEYSAEVTDPNAILDVVSFALKNDIDKDRIVKSLDWLLKKIAKRDDKPSIIGINFTETKKRIAR